MVGTTQVEELNTQANNSSVASPVNTNPTPEQPAILPPDNDDKKHDIRVQIENFIVNLGKLREKYIAILGEKHLAMHRLAYMSKLMEEQKEAFTQRFYENETSPSANAAQKVEQEIVWIQDAVKFHMNYPAIQENKSKWETFKSHRENFKILVFIGVALSAVIGGVVAGAVFGLAASTILPGAVVGAAVTALPAVLIYLTAWFIANRAKNRFHQLNGSVPKYATISGSQDSLKLTVKDHATHTQQEIVLQTVDLQDYLGNPVENSPKLKRDEANKENTLRHRKSRSHSQSLPEPRRSDRFSDKKPHHTAPSAPITPSAKPILENFLREKASREYTQESTQLVLQAYIRSMGGFWNASPADNNADELFQNYYLVKNTGSQDGKFEENTDLLSLQGIRYYAAILPPVSLSMVPSDAEPLQTFLNKDCGMNCYGTDVFDELLPLFKQQEQANSQDSLYARILFPVSVSTRVNGKVFSHWITFEINIEKVPASADESPNTFFIDIDHHDAKKIPEVATQVEKTLERLGEEIKKRILSSAEYKDANSSVEIATSEFEATKRQEDRTSCGPIIVHDILARTNGQDFSKMPHAAKLRETQIAIVRESFPPKQMKEGRSFLLEHDTTLLTTTDIQRVLQRYENNNTFKRALKSELEKRKIVLFGATAESLLSVPPEPEFVSTPASVPAPVSVPVVETEPEPESAITPNTVEPLPTRSLQFNQAKNQKWKPVGPEITSTQEQDTSTVPRNG